MLLSLLLLFCTKCIHFTLLNDMCIHILYHFNLLLIYIIFVYNILSLTLFLIRYGFKYCLELFVSYVFLWINSKLNSKFVLYLVCTGFTLKKINICHGKNYKW